MALLSACATQRVVRLDTGQGDLLEYRPPTSPHPVKVDAEAFEEALTHMVLNAPLTLRLRQHGWLVLASYPGNDEAPRWQRLMSKSYGGLCEPSQLVDASRELKWASDRAMTWEALEHASKRFANRVGPEVARVSVLVVTVVMSYGMTEGSAWLASRLAMLPNFPEAAALGASQLRLTLSEIGQVSAVAVSAEGTITIILAPTAVAMTGQGPSGGSKQEQYKTPKSGVSGKEGAKDVPSWAKGERPKVDESGKEFARRLLDKKYGEGSYDKGPGSEFSKIQKWGDRVFENP